MNAQQAAEKIGTDAKTLRRFIRSPQSTFKAVGSGARYEFNEKDIPILRKKFEEWRAGANVTRKQKSSTPVRAVEKFKDNDTPLPVSVLDQRMTRSRREERDRISRERADRLDAALRAAGKHISQMPVGTRF